MRSLPDPDLSLRDASDFIFDSPLARRALEDPEPRNLAVFLREVIQAIYKLTVSCHLPEFTDHGLGHLCSLVDRLSRWTIIGTEANPKAVVEHADFRPKEAAILLLATLLHDIGMLSQRPEDLPAEHGGHHARSLQDVPGWVRATHIARLERITRRLFATEFEAVLTNSLLGRAFAVARAHGSWPWDWSPFAFVENDAGLAAMLAVADLLDEDSMRCDSSTLLRHRYGTALNCAHWIRHSLTVGRVLVCEGQVDVEFGRPPRTDAQIEPVFAALRNHYRIVLLYLRELGQVNAGLLGINFDPPTGLPNTEVRDLEGWWEMPEFRFQSALVYHLLESFMAEALLDNRRLPSAAIHRLTTLGLTPVDLTEFYRFRGALAPRTPLEQTFHALIDNP